MDEESQYTKFGTKCLKVWRRDASILKFLVEEYGFSQDEEPSPFTFVCEQCGLCPVEDFLCESRLMKKDATITVRVAGGLEWSGNRLIGEQASTAVWGHSE